MVSVGSGKGTPLDGRSAMFEALGTLSNQIAMLYSVAIDQKRAINLSIIGTLGAPFINAHRAALLSIKIPLFCLPITLLIHIALILPLIILIHK